MPEFDYRSFAKIYIKKRLSEGKADAIEELSAYLADWLKMRQLAQGIRDDIKLGRAVK